jgi:crossover junction endodeoxyribonuclease RuvC
METSQNTEQIILGIDPGTLLMGYAILKVQKHEPALVTMDVLSLKSLKNNYVRLEKIFNHVSSLIEQYRPHALAIEAPFFGKNVQSMLKLGRAQGVAIAAAMYAQLTVTEYSPKKIKQSITGNGNATKEQVWKMLQQLLKITYTPPYFDATDALATALCHFYQKNNILKAQQKSFKNWKDFITKNEHLIVK